MSRAPIGIVLGPRPGIAACSFKQGIAEIVLRSLISVVSVGVIIAGSLQVDFVDGFTSTFPNFSVSDELKEDNVTTVYPITGITIVGEVCLATGAVGLAWEVTMILLRFLNIGILNLMSRGFLAIDIVVQTIIGILLTSVFLSAVIFSSLWSPIAEDKLNNSVLATAIVTGAAAVFMAVLILWMVLYMMCNWTANIITYTVKAELL